LYFLNQVFEPYGLKIVGQVIAFAGIVGLFVQPLWQLGKFFYTPGRMHKVKMPRVYATAATLETALALFLFLPLPCRVTCSLEVRTTDAESVYVEVPGEVVQWGVKPGDAVEAGVTLVKLANSDLQREVIDLEGQVQSAEAEVANLERLRQYEPTAGLQIAPKRETLDSLRDLLREKREQAAKLTIQAPIAGRVLSPPLRPSPRGQTDRLPTWTGSPFDPKNAHAHFTQSDLLCQIGDPHRMEAILVVDQADIELIQIGDRVDMRLDAYPGKVFTSQITQIANNKLEVSPPSLAVQHGGELDTRTDAQGLQRPLHTSYQMRTEPLERDDLVFQLGMRGKGKIATPWRSLSWRVFRYLSRTFHFEL
ncbi:MAG: efflux RND transporter periplasmic adaptor subunit, partial [Planctomycetota bacterium]